MRSGAELLGGVTVPLVTPMEAGGRPSAMATDTLLTEMARAGVRKVMLLGSNGEGPLIPTSLLTDFVAGVIDRWHSLTGTAGAVTVNVTAAGTLDAIERADIAACAGADALVMSPPIYFQHDDDEIVSHYAALAGVGIPVIAYNAPRYSNPVTTKVFEGLLELAHVVGIKDSSADLAQLRHLVERARTRPGFAISQGAEQQLAAALELGVDGITPGVANLAPGLSLTLMAAHIAGDRDQVHRSQQRITELTGLHAIRRGTPSIKHILAHLGLCSPVVAPPLRPCTTEEAAALLEFISPHDDQLLHPTKGTAPWASPSTGETSCARPASQG